MNNIQVRQAAAGVWIGLLGAGLLSGCGGAKGVSNPAVGNMTAGGAEAASLSSAREMSLGGMTTRVVGSAQTPVTSTSSQTAVTGIAGASITSLALNSNAAPTSGKSRIVFAKLSSGYILVSANPDGSDQQIINTGSTYNLYPAVSPDGSKVAYNAYDAKGYMQVFVVAITGGTPQQLTSDNAYNYKPNWSPDGARILYHRAVGDGSMVPYVVPANGGAPTVLWGVVDGSSPVFSPDGSKVAFTRSVGGYRQVFIANVSGSGTVQLTTGSTTSDPRWSPDGRSITFSRSDGSNEQIFVVDIASKSIYQVTNSGFPSYQPSFSPDGARILFQRLEGYSKYRLYTTSIYGNDLKPVTGAEDNLYSSIWAGFSKPAPVELIGGKGALGTGAAGMLYSRQGDAVSSVLTFDTATATLASRAAARVAAQTNADTNSPDIVFSVTANDSISRIAFANFSALATTPAVVNVPIPTGTTGALVDINSYTGKVAAVLPYAANRSIHFAPNVEKRDGRVTYRGNFQGAWNAMGENIAPEGAKAVELNPKTGELRRIE